MAKITPKKVKHGLYDYRVWWIINPPARPSYVYVNSPEEGWEVIEQQTRHQLRNPNIVANVFGLEIFEDGEWSDWYDKNGCDVFEHFEKDKNA